MVTKQMFAGTGSVVAGPGPVDANKVLEVPFAPAGATLSPNAPAAASAMVIATAIGERPELRIPCPLPSATLDADRRNRPRNEGA
jgi:hypothetical protein